MDRRPPEIYANTISQLMALCGVSLKTATRWKLGQTGPPESALRILRRDLGLFDPAWSGWTIWGDHIHSPEGWYASRAEVLSVQFLQSQLSAWRDEAKALRVQVAEMEKLRDSLEDQPLPSQWDLSAG